MYDFIKTVSNSFLIVHYLTLSKLQIVIVFELCFVELLHAANFYHIKYLATILKETCIPSHH